VTDLWDQRRKEHGKFEKDERERQARIFQAEAASPGLPREGRAPRNRPVLAAAVLGMCGGIVGVVLGAILAVILGSFFGDALAGHSLPPDYFEVLGYGIGSYCLVMIPCGSTLVGGIPGVIIARLRAAGGTAQPAIPPFVAGFLGGLLTTMVLTGVFLVTS
jgi:hypothetical protein